MGDMAVSNSIGSNIFDILLGLGFPWALRTLVVDHGSIVRLHSHLHNHFLFILNISLMADGVKCVFIFPLLQVSINNKGLVYSVVLLLASVFLTVSKYKLPEINLLLECHYSLGPIYFFKLCLKHFGAEKKWGKKQKQTFLHFIAFSCIKMI